MKIDKEILNEVNRFREIVGLQIILEQGISGPTKKLLKLFGSTSDETIDVLSRNVEFDNLIKASDQFAKLGITDVDSWTKYLTTKNLNINDLTQDQVNKLISDVPGLKSAIDEALNKATKEVAEKLMKTQSLANIFPKELVGMVDKAKSISITQGTADSAYRFYQVFNTKLDNFISELQKNGKQIPTELGDLKKLFKGKEDDALNYKKPSGVSKSVDDVSFDEIIISVESKLGKTLDRNDDFIKRLEALSKKGGDGKDLESKLLSYVDNLERRTKDSSLSDAQRLEAQKKLDQIITTVKKIGGTGTEGGISAVEFIKNFFVNFSTRKSLIGGLLNFLLTGFALFKWDDLLYEIEATTFKGTESCLNKVSGYKDIILDTEYGYTNTLTNWMTSEYSEDEVCYDVNDIPEDQQIKRFELLPVDDNYIINVIYKGGCTDKISIVNTDSGGWKISFKGGKKCGPNPKPEENSGDRYENTEANFKKWVNDKGYTNPDYNGLWYTENGTDKQATYSNGTYN